MIETVEFAEWADCLKLSGGGVEVIVTQAAGPRVLFFGREGGPNLFRVFPGTEGIPGAGEWRLYGGHRLWHAPEALPRSYQPDNIPVVVDIQDEVVTLIQHVEEATGIQKRMRLQVAPNGAVTVEHILTNKGLWPVTLAPWALTVMTPGGTAILPQPSITPGGDPYLLPNRTVTLWPYTRTNDPRLLWGERYLRLSTDPAIGPPCKIGLQASEGWCAYAWEGWLFLKRVPRQRSVEGYPDWGCGLESYTAGDFLELETLGALAVLPPGESTSHTETWFLFEGADAASEEAIDRTVLPRVTATGG